MVVLVEYCEVFQSHFGLILTLSDKICTITIALFSLQNLLSFLFL
ncbi:hypothetical protein MTTB_p280 (plasmid) [Methanothermobacter tenebrarum]|uniref:Uncharacterized protein n=1 Tax=Methanothermobacter tenebrarum TaxID=680118 RepID=A0ABM7YFT4_9EURY|nr:hypothetical protein MTTB_p280 [Methanothermobacter tenebrarum]